MKITSSSFAHGAVIPSRFAYGKIGSQGETELSENRNPELSWTDAPAGTRSFVVACLDDDVPTNREEKDARGELPAYQTRRRFVHWVQIDVPAEVKTIPEGALLNKLAAGLVVLALTTTLVEKRLNWAKQERAMMVRAHHFSMLAGTPIALW